MVTKFNEVFLDYQPCHDDNQDGPRNIGSIQTPDMADSPKGLHQ